MKQREKGTFIRTYQRKNQTAYHKKVKAAENFLFQTQFFRPQMVRQLCIIRLMSL